MCIRDRLGRAEQVGVVLAEVAAALDALQRAGGLIAEVVGDLADADGQLAVAVGLVGVDQDVYKRQDQQGRAHALDVLLPAVRVEKCLVKFYEEVLPEVQLLAVLDQLRNCLLYTSRCV